MQQKGTRGNKYKLKSEEKSTCSNQNAFAAFCSLFLRLQAGRAERTGRNLEEKQEYPEKEITFHLRTALLCQQIRL